MKIINNSNHNIVVSDLGITIPISKLGVISVKEEHVCGSNDLIALIASGQISALPEHEVTQVSENNSKFYFIPGFLVWPGEGNTKPYDRYSEKKMPLSKENIVNSLLSMRKPIKKYKIKKTCSSSVSLESLGAILTNLNPIRSITESQIHNKDIQIAVSRGLIQIVETENQVSDSDKDLIDKDQISVKKLFERPLGNIYSNLKCFWEGPIFDSGGYANMNREYVRHLTNLGVRIVPTLVETSNDIEKEVIDEIVRMNCDNSKYVSKNKLKVYATNVPCKHAGPVIAYTMMETENRIHPKLVKSMDIADELWVPCEWNKNIFARSKVKAPIHVMPLGVDTDLYAPRDSKIDYSFPTKKFVFYSASTWIWRKGFDVLLKAYSKAFSADDDVSLIIFTKIPGYELKDMEAKIRQDIRSFVDYNASLPHLVVINTFLPTFLMPYLYNSIDCFVLFSRGEGWGLPYCEATASGVPVIGAAHGGQEMFLNENNSFLIKPDKIAPCHHKMLYMSPFYKDMVFADYSDHAIGQAADAMRHVYECYEEAKQKSKLCRKSLLGKYTWEKCALRVANRIKELS